MAFLTKLGTWFMQLFLSKIIDLVVDLVRAWIERKKAAEEQKKKDEELKKKYEEALEYGTDEKIEEATEDLLNGR